MTTIAGDPKSYFCPFAAGPCNRDCIFFESYGTNKEGEEEWICNLEDSISELGQLAWEMLEERHNKRRVILRG